MRKTDVVFFLSGAAALGYETIWARLAARVLGSDASAAALVVAVFMGGMGLGARWGGSLAARVRSPVRAFAWLEIAVGVYAACSGYLLHQTPVLDSLLTRALYTGLLFLPPTIALGVTFPLMARLAIRSNAESGSETSAFYGANTLGAAAGALGTTFLLLPATGLRSGLLVCGLFDVFAALLALAVLRDASASPAASDRPPETTRIPRENSASARVLDPVLWATALLGATTLALEVLLLRLLVTVTGASVYAFAIVLGVFLFGIGIGSRQFAETRTRLAVPESRANEYLSRARSVLFFAALCVPLLTVAGLFALELQLGENDLFAGLSNRTPQGASLARVWFSHVLFAALSLLPLAIASGMALPAACASAIATRAGVAREVRIGRVYAWNTLGALCGSLGAGFVLLPVVGPRLGMALVLVLPFAAAFLVDQKRRLPLAIALVTTLAIGSRVLAPVDAHERPPPLLLFHDAHTTAMVEEVFSTASTPVRSIRVNGKPEASTATVDVRLQYLLGHIPGVLHGDVRTALVIGLGTGMTSGSLLDLPRLESLTIVEISTAVVRCARAFAAWNHDVLDEPRTVLRLGDGRFALASSSARYDLVTSDPVHPWTRGSSDLYTLEHFRAMRAHLANGGVASQWLALYELATEDVKTVVATWCAAFEHVSVYLSAYDLVLVGSAARLPAEGQLASTPLPPRMLESGRTIGVLSGLDLAALLVADDARARAWVTGVEPMLDDRPVIEFRAPYSALAGYCVEVLAWAIDAEADTIVEPAARARATQVRAHLTRFLEALPRGFTSAADRLGQDLARVDTAR